MAVSSPTTSVPGEFKDTSFRPYIPASAELTELSLSAVLLGSVLGVVFGASSLYLFLKVSMTVSASIPVAVLAITIFRGVSRAFGTRQATILENNIVQTAGSAGESIAFGVGAAMPALMLLGYELEWTRVMLVAVLGGLLGILMMIPLRKAFIVKQHGVLPYPEGTACAKVLIVGERGGSNAKTVFLGFGLGFVYQILMQGLKLWSGEWEKAITGIKGYSKAIVSLEPAPALLGVGYIIGPRIASVMVGGGILTSLLLTPMIAFFGDALPDVLPPGQQKISTMNAGQISVQYVRYIGAGAVAAGGILSMLNALPLIASSIRGSLSALGSKRNQSRLDPDEGYRDQVPRTDRDIPMPFVLLGSIGLTAAIAASNLIPTDLTGRVLGGLLVVLFGFLFVTVSSRITGVIGSSSNPISGMTIATLLLTCLIFVLLGWVGSQYSLVALSIAGVVCIASSNGGTTSQDLKTGYLVGATPWKQQVAILVGALVSALVMGGTLLLLNDAYSTTTDRPEDLPSVQADVSKLTQTDVGKDGRTYKVWWVLNPQPGVLPGKYLVDETGEAKFLKDPGIGGRLTYSNSGAPMKKFSPAQPQLFATIIDGVMSGDLPWGLVVLGAVLAVVMQLAGVSALAFAVGVYLPLSTTMPIFVGGMIRALVDRLRGFSTDESERSAGTMMSTGLIAGGSLAGIIIALLVVFESLGQALDFSTRDPSGEILFRLPAIGVFSILALALLAVALAGKRPDAEEIKADTIGGEI
ncbi:MAG TPA: oligopeptide transporter, OPT family [Isosphaeraceae bacterium]|nr:oligopeptide transporter, OPT family [Isosphaeraceae bacterium]